MCSGRSCVCNVCAGVSHAAAHTVFRVGAVASAALKEFVETGRSDRIDAATYAAQVRRGGRSERGGRYGHFVLLIERFGEISYYVNVSGNGARVTIINSNQTHLTL